MARFNGMDLNYNVVKTAAKINVELNRKGEKIGYTDVLIGNTAHFFQFILLT
ncbi:MAG: hypothetical protein ACFFAJ_13670 [Candidatus Hodarchaeota archaeon]